MRAEWLRISAFSSRLWAADTSAQVLGPLLKQVCAKPPRRVNRFIQLALLGAHDCAAAAGSALAPQTGLYLATGQGNVADTARLMCDIQVQGEAPMPFTFINVSSNMAGFYVAQALGLEATNLTASQQDFSFEAALELACVDLAEGGSALLGAVEECVWPLQGHRRRLGLAAQAVLAEGSHWLLLDQADPKPLAYIEALRLYADERQALAALSQQAWQPHTFFAAGVGLSQEDARRCMVALGLTQRFDYLQDGAYHDSLSAYALCRFMQTHERGRLLHLNRGRDGRVYAFSLVVGEPITPG